MAAQIVTEVVRGEQECGKSEGQGIRVYRHSTRGSTSFMATKIYASALVKLLLV